MPFFQPWKKRTFTEHDVGYLANLCHNCGACYHARQYAPPHESGVNVPQAMAAARNNSYAAHAWPGQLAALFQHHAGLVVTMVISAGLAVTVGLLAMIAPGLFWGVHIGEGAFYTIMPHTVMAGIPMAISAFVLVSFVMGWRADIGGILGLGGVERVDQCSSGGVELRHLW